MRKLNINLFTAAGLSDIVFAIYSTSNPGHLLPSTLDLLGAILFYQSSNMNLINATLLLIRFSIMYKINFICLFYLRVYIFYGLLFIHSAVGLFSLCEHLHLSYVFYNKFTFLLFPDL